MWAIVAESAIALYLAESSIQESDRKQQKNASNPANGTVDGCFFLIYSLD